METVKIKTCAGMTTYLRIRGGLLLSEDAWDAMILFLEEVRNQAVNHELDRLSRIIHVRATP